jgi:hypothetical protein
MELFVGDLLVSPVFLDLLDAFAVENAKDEVKTRELETYSDALDIYPEINSLWFLFYSNFLRLLLGRFQGQSLTRLMFLHCPQAAELKDKRLELKEVVDIVLHENGVLRKHLLV